jgi:hypothetical protein
MKKKSAIRRTVPRTRAGGEWTEAEFWSFLRSGLREKSRRWPPLVRQVFDVVRRKNRSENRRLKWEYQCRRCEGWFPRNQVEADHVVPCGSLRSFSDLEGFAERLFVEVDGLQVLCADCHAWKTCEKVKEG